MKLRAIGHELAAPARLVWVAFPARRGASWCPRATERRAPGECELIVVFACCREALYKHGGLLSVTSRILVVDLLSKKLPAEAIAGLVVLHAEE